MNDLGAYVLPGGPTDPSPIIEQARAAEDLELGTVFVGERYATKDLPSLLGALTQTTSTVRLGAAITHIGTRHPMVLASMGQTLQALSGGRFVLGLGRGAAARWRSYGVTPPTIEMLADTADILRRLWAGERVTYTGPAGTYPDLALMERPDDATPPPLLLAGVGPRTLHAAGSAFDGAILHPMLTPDAVGRAAERIRAAATEAGRDPDRVEIHATVVVSDEASADRIVRARGVGYLLMSGLGEALVSANGWDPDLLASLRNHPRVSGLAYHELKSVPTDDLATMSRDLPDRLWLDAAAIGSPTDCAARLDAYLAAGATHVLIHGSTPDQLGPLVASRAARG